jgi:hypothetical protein
MTTNEICKLQPTITNNLLEHTVLFSNNRQSIGNMGQGVNAFLIFCGVIEELNSEKAQVRIKNIKTKVSEWYALSDICLEDDLGIKTEQDHLQLIENARHQHEQ